ncbi:MAG: hypothetical protein V4623_03875, partial [Pseudomonadota bacterium]
MHTAPSGSGSGSELHAVSNSVSRSASVADGLCLTDCLNVWLDVWLLRMVWLECDVLTAQYTAQMIKLTQQLSRFLTQAETLLSRLDTLLAAQTQAVTPFPQAPEWSAASAFRWRKKGDLGFLQPLPKAASAAIKLADLHN